MNLVFLGNPEIAIPALDALLDAGHNIVAVVCSPDARKGRRGQPTPTPVKAHALERGLKVLHDHNELLGLDYDIGIVVAYGHILPTELIAHAPLINIHFSLLPRWRGAAPVERAILAGDRETGVAIMAIEEGLDTGAVYNIARTPIDDADTVTTIRDRLALLGATLLVDTLQDGLPTPTPQSDSGVTYAHKLSSADFEIDWTQPAVEVHRLVRLERAWTVFRGKRLRIHQVQVHTSQDEDSNTGVDNLGKPGLIQDGLVVLCGLGAVQLISVQPEGKHQMAAKDWANGAQPIGEYLG